MGKNKIFINFIFQEQFLLFMMNRFSRKKKLKTFLGNLKKTKKKYFPN